ncbi:MAG: hypothetical protein ACLVB5_15240 [Christensenellales bacterium]
MEQRVCGELDDSVEISPALSEGDAVLYTASSARADRRAWPVMGMSMMSMGAQRRVPRRKRRYGRRPRRLLRARCRDYRIATAKEYRMGDSYVALDGVDIHQAARLFHHRPVRLGAIDAG